MWKQVHPSIPPSLQTQVEEIEQKLATAPAQVDSRLALLARVAGQIPQRLNPVASAGAGHEAMRKALNDLLQGGGKCLCIHPYLHPVGDKRGDYSYLTPQQVVQHLYNKLADPSDISEMQAAVVVGLQAVDHADMAETLARINAVFPVLELQKVMRRARSLHNLERDKFITPTGPIHPVWQEQSPHRHKTPRTMDSTMGVRLAQLEAYARQTVRPEQELAKLLEQKKTALGQAAQAWKTLAEQMAGGTAHGLYFEGTPGGLRDSLQSSPAGDGGYKLAALVCWTGTKEHVKIFKEVFGL